MASSRESAARRTRSSSRLGRRGFTLVEIVVSVLLTAVMVSAVFSVALTTRTGGGKTDRKIVAAQASRQVTSALRNYVTADQTAPITGPGASNPLDQGQAGLASWRLPGDTCNCYALQAGSHTVTGVLPTWFESTPYNATVEYFVAYPGGASDPPWVNVTINWTEP